MTPINASKQLVAMRLRHHAEQVEGPLSRLRDELDLVQSKGVVPGLEKDRHCSIAWNAIDDIDRLLESIARLVENLEADDAD